MTENLDGFVVLGILKRAQNLKTSKSLECKTFGLKMFSTIM